MNSEEKPKTVKHCTVCLKPVKGHRGPCGAGKCDKSPSDIDTDNEYEEKVKIDEKKTPVSDSDDESESDSEPEPLKYTNEDIAAAMLKMTDTFSALCSQLKANSGAKPEGDIEGSPVYHPPNQHPPHLQPVHQPYTQPKYPPSGANAAAFTPHHIQSMSANAGGGHTVPPSSHVYASVNPSGAPTVPPSGQPYTTSLQGARPAAKLGPDIPHSCVPGLRATSHITDYGAYCDVVNIPDKTVKAALNGEFVQISDFLNNYTIASENITDLQQYVDSYGNVQYKPKRPRRRVTDYKSWSEAWLNYQKTVVNYHGLHLHDEMVNYHLQIMEYDTKFNWSAVAAFDMRHRAGLSRQSPYFHSEMKSSNLSTTVMDATMIKPSAPRCPRCLSFDHTNVSMCPFPAGASPMAAAAPVQTQIQFKARRSTNTEICRNFNDGQCTFRQCRRQHICKLCGGSLPYIQCITQGSCANIQPSESTNQGSSEQQPQSTTIPSYYGNYGGAIYQQQGSCSFPQ